MSPAQEMFIIEPVTFNPSLTLCRSWADIIQAFYFNLKCEWNLTTESLPKTLERSLVKASLFNFYKKFVSSL